MATRRAVPGRPQHEDLGLVGNALYGLMGHLGFGGQHPLAPIPPGQRLPMDPTLTDPIFGALTPQIRRLQDIPPAQARAMYLARQFGNRRNPGAAALDQHMANLWRALHGV